MNLYACVYMCIAQKLYVRLLATCSNLPFHFCPVLNSGWIIASLSDIFGCNSKLLQVNKKHSL